MNTIRLSRMLLTAGIVCSLAWIVFVLSLDIRYDMFPRVSIGGLKILLGGWLLAGLVMLLKATITMLLRQLRATMWNRGTTRGMRRQDQGNNS